MDGEIGDRYRDFAAYARDDSPCFEAWALGVADETEVHAWLADLPRIKRTIRERVTQTNAAAGWRR